MTILTRIPVATLAFAACSSAFGGSPADPSRLFQNAVSPLLREHCLRCHGPEKQRGGLDLNQRSSLLEGGSHGPAVVPGKPEESPLYRKVIEGKMPPGKPLDPKHAAVLKDWIERGAVFPGRLSEAVAAKQPEIPWSFVPLKNPALPRSGFDGLARNPIDRFLFAELEKKGLRPSPPAERLQLLRRVTFDLTGLPPTWEEVDDFLRDDSPSAYEKVVRRLLGSPAYGERWARHWLDVVRFGESHGYEQNHIRPNAWPYRDYVVRSFNADKPFDRFVLEQLAGDVLAPDDPLVLPATGFLVAGVHDTVGNQTEEGRRTQRWSDLEDMVSTTGAAFLGLTIGCARCHEHKFDPIPQADFYRLAAVFAGVQHGERELAGKAAPKAAVQVGEAAYRKARIALADIEEKGRHRLLHTQKVEPKRPSVDPTLNLEDFPPQPAKYVRFVVEATQDGTQPCIDELEIYGEKGLNLALAERGARATASSEYPGNTFHKIQHVHDGKLGNGRSWIPREVASWIRIELPREETIRRVVWSRDGSLRPVYKDRLATAYRIELSRDGSHWITVVEGKSRANAREAILPTHLLAHLTEEETDQRRELQETLGRLRKAVPDKEAGKAYIGRFTPPQPVQRLHRGDVMQPREDVEPGGLSRLPGVSADFGPQAKPTEGERRLALARWIVDPANPLTPRVLVNRLWQHHFGRGLVATPSDFGNNGTSPSHPDLLDWLARDFVAGGWKLKRLHELMVTSYAYRQSASVTPEGSKIDAGNVFLWRMPLRRLEAEGLRDALLSVSGKLDRKMGGPSFLPFRYRVVNVAIYEPLEEFGPQTWRRSLYALNARAYRSDLMASFDTPECAQRTPRRESTTTALQALTLLNGKFAVQQAGFFAERVEREAGSNRSDQVMHAFRLAFGRAPTVGEARGAEELLAAHGLPTLCRALMNANEFLHY